MYAGPTALDSSIQSGEVLCHQDQDRLGQHVLMSSALIPLETPVFFDLCEYAFRLDTTVDP